MAQKTTLAPNALPGQAYGSFAGKSAAATLQPGVVTLVDALAHSASLTDALVHSVTVGETQNG